MVWPHAVSMAAEMVMMKSVRSYLSVVGQRVRNYMGIL